MEYTICPHSENCPIYQAWAEKMDDEKIDVIVKGNRHSKRYDCLALIALSSDCAPKFQIDKDHDVRKRLFSDKPGCPVLIGLNSGGRE
jgi:hypothetical protein